MNRTLDSFNHHAGSAPLSDVQLLDMIQQQTLKYFWDFAHPVSFMARERSNPVANYDHLETVTTGGTGFGVMALIAGVERGWLDRKAVRGRLHKMLDFLDASPTYHGAFPHFMNGSTGAIIPFSERDDGADLVETSFLMMGLLSARQYFARDKPLADKINKLFHAVEWDFFTRGQPDQLYWHWSPKHEWAMNLPIRGWNECLITYVMAASSPTHPIHPDSYHQGWAGGAEFKNGEHSGNLVLPLGPKGGGPLFMSQYSFLGIDPRGLRDRYADYWLQNTNHTLINYQHCVTNPHQHTGYGPDCWGLTACDAINSYDAHSPIKDTGVIAPTAALSAFPYTPVESMRALRHFHEVLGDTIRGPYGFRDSFHQGKNWQAAGHLAIDQGPIVVMIENHRSGLLWKLLMSCPELRHGLKVLSFESAPSCSPASSRPHHDFK